MEGGREGMALSRVDLARWLSKMITSLATMARMTTTEIQKIKCQLSEENLKVEIEVVLKCQQRYSRPGSMKLYKTPSI